METEYEATFWPIGKDESRAKLEAAGAKRVYPERLMRRVTFSLPPPLASIHRWARVRDEGDRVTMSVKQVSGDGIEGQKEVMVVIDDFTQGVVLLKALGCLEKAYQETKRELWMLDGIEVTIDEWPFLEPFIEIEGASESAVQMVAGKLGFDWKDARFCAVGTLYRERYGKTENYINNDTPRIVFDGQNPFV